MTDTQTVSFDAAHAMLARDQGLADAVALVARLDFSMLKAKLVGESGWSEEYCEEVEELYRQFLALNARYWGRKICPTGPIDAFWHAHIVDTRAYSSDCESVFGEYLHHYPYFGLRGPDDRRALEEAFQESAELFVSTFGIDPTLGDGAARTCASQRCP